MSDNLKRTIELGNLRGASRAANEHDKRRHGPDNSGARNGRAKITPDIARAVRNSKGPRDTVARAYGVSVSTVSDIRNGRSWKCLDPVPSCNKTSLTLVIPDVHIPYHLPAALESCLRHGESLPALDRIVLIGDLIDCYTVSRFCKDPRRKTTLAGEVKVASELLRDLRRRFPGCEVHFCEGNHEDRLRKYLWRQAPELEGLKGLSVPELLGVESLNIHWHSAGFRVGKLLYTHGNRIRKLAGQTARVMSEELATSVICGHSHRQGWCPRTTPEGLYDAYEVGCLCDYKQLDYVDTAPNWQEGWATVVQYPSGAFHVDFARIVRGSGTVSDIYWRGQLIDTLSY